MISIPKPCHENWNEMTPTQKGAFCGKCQIDVIDFSKMTDVEIKETLIAQRGNHLCGKFKTTQLETFNLKYSNWENQPYHIFQSKFILACLIAFGMSLFSCTNQQHFNLNSLKTVNTIEIADSKNHPTDTTIIEQIGTKTTLNYATDVLGQVAIEEVEIENITCSAQPDILGDMVIDEEFYERNVKGEIAINHNFYTDTLQRVPQNNEQSAIPLIEAQVYPNPVQSITHLKLILNQSGQTQITLFDMQGKILLNIYEGNIEAGSNEFEINLENYKPGNYFIKILQGNSNSTLQLIKI